MREIKEAKLKYEAFFQKGGGGFEK